MHTVHTLVFMYITLAAAVEQIINSIVLPSLQGPVLNLTAGTYLDWQ